MDDENKTTAEPSADGTKRPPSRGWLILGILACPGVLSLIVLMVEPGDYGGNALLPILFGCPIAGIGAAWLFAAGLRKASMGHRVAAGITMALVFTVLSAGLAFGGCMLVLQIGSL